MMNRKVFQIGFNKCGTKFLTELFEINGIPGIHWAAGSLAEDIAYSKAIGRKPLMPWENSAVLFTDMESVHRYSQPMIEAFKEYEFLDKSYPESIFILNTRNVEDWIISRYMHQGGAYANFHAKHLGVALPDLAEIWYADWHKHIESCRNYFSGRAEFIEIDIDEAGPEDYQEKFGKWYDLSRIPDFPKRQVMEQRAGYLPRLAEALLSQGGNDDFDEIEVETIAHEFAEFSEPVSINIRQCGYTACSSMMAQFDSVKKTVRNKNHDLLPLRQGENGFYYTDIKKDKFIRTAGVVNEITQYAQNGVFIIDMQDGRQIGSRVDLQVASPIISYCRREGAENVFLWPLPEYHSIGADYFPGQVSKDNIKFYEKRDRAVWRGAVSGHCSDVRGAEFRFPVHQQIKRILDNPIESSDCQEAINMLEQNIRYAFVNKFYGNPDIDARFTPNSDGQAALRKIGKDYLLDEFRRSHFFYRHKYIITLRGYDTGSNFLFGLNSNSIVLKEEDGWELFYSFLFKPWLHYIPLISGGDDVEEKIEWARKNTEKCVEMSARAKDQCRKLASKRIRDRYLEMLIEKYKVAAGGSSA